MTVLALHPETVLLFRPLSDRMAGLCCDDCGEVWTLHVPKNNSMLEDVVFNNKYCIRCQSDQVLQWNVEAPSLAWPGLS